MFSLLLVLSQLLIEIVTFLRLWLDVRPVFSLLLVLSQLLIEIVTFLRLWLDVRPVFSLLLVLSQLLIVGYGWMLDQCLVYS